MAMTKIKGLQMWCRKMTEGYAHVDIANFTSAWRDGLAFCAIIHRFRPDLIDFDSLSPENVFENNKMAFEIAEQELGIPAFLEAEDMARLKMPDKLSVITYVSQYYNFLNSLPQLGGPGVKEKVSSTVSHGTKRPPDQDSTQAPSSKKATTVDNKGQGKNASATGDKCAICQNRVYLLERHIEGGKLYHRSCYRHSELSPTSKVYTRSPFLSPSLSTEAPPTPAQTAEKTKKPGDSNFRKDEVKSGVVLKKTDGAALKHSLAEPDREDSKKSKMQPKFLFGGGEQKSKAQEQTEVDKEKPQENNAAVGLPLSGKEAKQLEKRRQQILGAEKSATDIKTPKRIVPLIFQQKEKEAEKSSSAKNVSDSSKGKTPALVTGVSSVTTASSKPESKQGESSTSETVTLRKVADKKTLSAVSEVKAAKDKPTADPRSLQSQQQQKTSMPDVQSLQKMFSSQSTESASKTSAPHPVPRPRSAVLKGPSSSESATHSASSVSVNDGNKTAAPKAAPRKNVIDNSEKKAAPPRSKLQPSGHLSKVSTDSSADSTPRSTSSSSPPPLPSSAPPPLPSSAPPCLPLTQPPGTTSPKAPARRKVSASSKAPDKEKDAASSAEKILSQARAALHSKDKDSDAGKRCSAAIQKNRENSPRDGDKDNKVTSFGPVKFQIADASSVHLAKSSDRRWSTPQVMDSEPLAVFVTPAEQKEEGKVLSGLLASLAGVRGRSGSTPSVSHAGLTCPPVNTSTPGPAVSSTTSLSTVSSIISQTKQTGTTGMNSSVPSSTTSSSSFTTPQAVSLSSSHSKTVTTSKAASALSSTQKSQLPERVLEAVSVLSSLKPVGGNETTSTSKILSSSPESSSKILSLEEKNSSNISVSVGNTSTSVINDSISSIKNTDKPPSSNSVTSSTTSNNEIFSSQSKSNITTAVSSSSKTPVSATNTTLKMKMVPDVEKELLKDTVKESSSNSQKNEEMMMEDDMFSDTQSALEKLKARKGRLRSNNKEQVENNEVPASAKGNDEKPSDSKAATSMLHSSKSSSGDTVSQIKNVQLKRVMPTSKDNAQILKPEKVPAFEVKLRKVGAAKEGEITSTKIGEKLPDDKAKGGNISHKQKLKGVNDKKQCPSIPQWKKSLEDVSKKPKDFRDFGQEAEVEFSGVRERSKSFDVLCVSDKEQGQTVDSESVIEQKKQKEVPKRPVSVHVTGISEKDDKLDWQKEAERKMAAFALLDSDTEEEAPKKENLKPKRTLPKLPLETDPIDKGKSKSSSSQAENLEEDTSNTRPLGGQQQLPPKREEKHAQNGLAKTKASFQIVKGKNALKPVEIDISTNRKEEQQGSHKENEDASRKEDDFRHKLLHLKHVDINNSSMSQSTATVLSEKSAPEHKESTNLGLSRPLPLNTNSNSKDSGDIELTEVKSRVTDMEHILKLTQNKGNIQNTSIQADSSKAVSSQSSIGKDMLQEGHKTSVTTDEGEEEKPKSPKVKRRITVLGRNKKGGIVSPPASPVPMKKIEVSAKLLDFDNASSEFESSLTNSTAKLSIEEKHTPPPRPPPPHPHQKAMSPRQISAIELQQQLLDIDSRLTDLELRGRELEDSIRNVSIQEEDDDTLMIEWFKLISDKNELVRQEADLVYISREQDLEDEQQQLESQLQYLMSKPAESLSPAEKEEEAYLLQRKIDIVNQRSCIVDSMDEDRLRYQEEDRDIEFMLKDKGFWKDSSGTLKALKGKKVARSKFYT